MLATKVKIIFGLTSLISSQTHNTVAPILRATEITYFALPSISSSVSPLVTQSQSIAIGSTDFKRANKYLQLFNELSWNDLIGSTS